MKTELCSIFEKYNADKCPSVFHTYSPIYYELLKDIRYDVSNVLEIGIGTASVMTPVTGPGYIPGASIKGWRDFFPNANVYAVDIDEHVLFTDERIITAKMDQSSVDNIRSYIKDTNVTFDLIIDDGSHLINHQIISAYELSKSLRNNGIYIIEDIHYKYLSAYEDIKFPGLEKIHTHIGGKDPWDNFIAYKKNVNEIPKILHMVWVGNEEPPNYFWDNLNKWKSLMPNWTYMVWTNDMLTEEYFDREYLNLISKVINPSQASDFIRFYVMNKWGGYYLDADVTPIRNLEELPAENPIILCNDLPETGPWYMMCAFMAGVPNHSLWQLCIDECWNVDVNIKYGEGVTPTGPAVLGYVSQQLVDWDSVGGYTQLPYWYFYRNRVGDPGPYIPDRIMRDHPDAFGNHFYAASWK